MRPLLRHQTYDVHFVDLVADLEFVELRMESFQILAHRVKQADEQGLLTLDQIDIDLCFSLNKLFMKVVWCLHCARNVNQLWEFKLEVFLEFCHLQCYFIELGDTIFLEVIH